MNYKHYFHSLTPLETRLVEDGYWRCGFIDTHGKSTPALFPTGKWSKMIRIIAFGLDVQQVPWVTPELMLMYMDDPGNPEFERIDKLIKNELRRWK